MLFEYSDLEYQFYFILFHFSSIWPREKLKGTTSEIQLIVFSHAVILEYYYFLYPALIYLADPKASWLLENKGRLWQWLLFSVEYKPCQNIYT